MFPYEHTGILYDTSLRCDHISIVAKLTEGFRGRAKTKNNRETFLLRFVSRSFPVVLPPLSFCRLFTQWPRGETTMDLLRGVRRNSCGECPHIYTHTRIHACTHVRTHTHTYLDVKSRSPNTRVQQQTNKKKKGEKERKRK